MTEIKVQYQSLEDYVRILRNLAERLQERRFLTTKLINESDGKTCEALNDTYEILCETECSLKKLVMMTADWLEKAKISFWEAEHRTIQDTDQLFGL